MADAAVEFLLANLTQLVLYNADLISGVKDHVDSLSKHLRLLGAFLKDASEKRSKYESVKELVRQIRDEVYEAEDIIDTFVVQAAVHKARNRIQKIFHIFDYPAKLRSVAKSIESMEEKVKDIYEKKKFGFEFLQDGMPSDRSLLEKRPPVVEEVNVVGFDKEAKILVDQLTASEDELKVISVVGMGGLGKTTLARKVYNDPLVQSKFINRAWVYVSQEFSRREVFLGILNSVTRVTRDMYSMSEEMLADELRRHLQSARYLIVVDDVWTKEAWNGIKLAFPNINNKSRVMLTSRHKHVAVHADPDSPPHKLRFLTEDESWELLRTKVFRKRICPSELELLGREISKKCYGLPLAIVVIAGILLKMERTSSCWESVAESVSSYIDMNPEECMDVLALSYNHLPYDLKACFLYFGVFPEDFEIPVRKLIHIWIAEGFIQPVKDISLEDIAEYKLLDLVDRNLVLVEKRRSNGRIKTCRIHDMLHDLCVKRGEEEIFLKEFKVIVPIPSSSATPNFFRRLSVHSQVVEYISSKPSGPRVRSFLCFASEEKVLAPQYIPVIPGAFNLLRVLDMSRISFSRFPSETVQLVHLRYIALLGKFSDVPTATSKLWNLQTVIFNTKSPNLNIKADIWKMLHLRHLYTSASSTLPIPDVNPSVNENLQTISALSPKSCSDHILARTPNLKKLGIRGDLVTLVDKSGSSSRFDCLAKLKHLKTLKLLNDAFPSPPSKLPVLPQSSEFPPKLKKLTLSDTLLDWKHMSILGMLKGLEVLKLGENAFSGKHWKTLDGGFVQLKVFELGKTNLEQWEASACHFPGLERIILKNLECLDKIPSALGEVSALQVMDLYHVTVSAADSAREIQRKQQDRPNNGFKLIIDRSVITI